MEKKKNKSDESKPPLMALNHVSRLCRDVKKSLEFYTKVLGFVETERPASLDFDGAWLFNYGVGIHLVQAKDEEKLPSNTEHLDPMDNHISFQCEDMEALEKRLKEVDVKYIKRTVGEQEDAAIDQLFFNDPDGFMVEICNCENLELKPRDSADAIPPAPAPSDDDADDDSEEETENFPSPTPSPAPAEEGEPEDIKASEDGEFEQEEGEDRGMSGWKKAGIVIGALLGVGAIAIGALIYKKRQDNLARARYTYFNQSEFL
ncbi:hypothetical protein F2Q68_00024994 [Brassica cretica]|uniref:VOC domain-containing protein n=1 Tax=Brassica cretica TaxID=69181 RepID=A0A8S9IE78_BRACR|nr:hypothetical protein F2Q68_00024994 [Brassica cretica]